MLFGAFAVLGISCRGEIQDPPGASAPRVPGDPKTSDAPPSRAELSALRKVKSALTGLSPTEAEIAVLTRFGSSGFRKLVRIWMSQPEFQLQFQGQLQIFFRYFFQQTGFVATEDFKPQLLQIGGFDFGGVTGDDAFNRLTQNLRDSFALTALGLVQENRPFTEVLTTRRFMLTTALKSLYLQIEMPRQRPDEAPFFFSIDESGLPIPLSETLDPRSPHYLTFADVAPSQNATAFAPFCRGTQGMVNRYSGYEVLFQALLGFVQTTRGPDGAVLCEHHSSRPYFTRADLSDWQWVTTRAPREGEAQLLPYDLPSLRQTDELALQLPRVGFFTTPAFLALWNTNDSNQHRVTANQTLLVALGQSFSSENTIVPISEDGLDAAHSVSSVECYGCHRGLDPLRQFWANSYDFDDRNDFLEHGEASSAPNPRPNTTGGVLAFGDVNRAGNSLDELGTLLAEVTDASLDGAPVNRFALAVTQRLCHFANAAPCPETDPELLRIARSFQKNNFDFMELVLELFSSPLVTGLAPSKAAPDGVPVSTARKDQLCASLSNRLGRDDLCSLLAALPTAPQLATQKAANAVPADGFSRGTVSPLTPSEPSLFHAAATELLCENIAALVVDGPANVYASNDVNGALEDMVSRLMGYSASDPNHAEALRILREDYDANIEQSVTAVDALRSTFSLACQAPTTLSLGL